MMFFSTGVNHSFCSRRNRWQLLLICATMAIASSGRVTSRIRCNAPDDVPNGSHAFRRNSVMRINCRPGYTLLGPRVIDCVNGKWFGEKPVCAKNGCPTRPTNPENGQVQIVNQYKAILFCSDNYNLAGNRFAYCNGTQWDRQIGNCRERKNSIQHDCDFETEDICGWVFEPTENYEWKRVMAANKFTSFQTGPRHDHTVQHAPTGGHYMLMESLGGKLNGSALPLIPLMSPIFEQKLSLRTACCFRFYYFMYGASVGTLSVFVRPISITLEQLTTSEQNTYMKFTKSGSQNNIWNMAQFDIEEVFEDFQIVFMATGGRTHLSDIAIDDVHLMTGTECSGNESPYELDVTENFASSTTTDMILYDTQSCVSRCMESSGSGLVIREGKFFGLCNCHAECEISDSCCPDFRAVCLEDIFADTSPNTIENNAHITENIFLAETAQMELKEDVMTKPVSYSTTSTKATTKTTPKSTTKIITTTRKPTTTTSTSTSTKLTTATQVQKKTSTTTPKSTTQQATTTISITSTYLAPQITTMSETVTTTTITDTVKTTKVKHADPQQPTTWLVDRKKVGTTTIPDRRQTQYGANVLKLLLIILAFAMLLGTLWYRFESRLLTIFAKRKDPHNSADVADTTVDQTIEVTSAIGAKFKATSSSSIHNGAEFATSRKAKSQKTGKQKPARINVTTDDTASLLWRNETEESDDSDDFVGIALQNKNSTIL